jgi:hypothetical protein
MKTKSKFPKIDGRWRFEDILPEAARITREYMKDQGEAVYGRRIGKIVEKGQFWKLDGCDAFAVYDALASESNLDPALLPLARWVSLLQQLHDWSAAR